MKSKLKKLIFYVLIGFVITCLATAFIHKQIDLLEIYSQATNRGRMGFLTIATLLSGVAAVNELIEF